MIRLLSVVTLALTLLLIAAATHGGAEGPGCGRPLQPRCQPEPKKEPVKK